MKAYYRNFNQDIYKDNISGERIKGGYGSPEYNVIYIDLNLPLEKRRLVAIHEVLELCFPRVAHKRIDKASIDLIDVLLQLGLFKSIP